MSGDLTTLGAWQRIGNTIYILHERAGRHGRPIKCNKIMLNVSFDTPAIDAVEQDGLLNEIVDRLNATVVQK